MHFVSQLQVIFFSNLQKKSNTPETEMWKDKSPGLKILWLWTFGTAAIMVTSVVRTRVRDMEQLVNAQQDPVADTLSGNNGSSESAQVIIEDKS